MQVKQAEGAEIFKPLPLLQPAPAASILPQAAPPNQPQPPPTGSNRH